MGEILNYKEYSEKMKDVAIRLLAFYDTTKGKGKVWSEACTRLALEAKYLLNAYAKGDKKK